ncbi:alkaline phosphatase [Aquabacterium sp.]|uniref:alkaline phosphatase n=1 Tax=Aquabacterium sp. TaxID=1872578 RepID=UPI0025B8AFB1|nr:alkaline phosphatase [Aquabacterium sp.]
MFKLSLTAAAALSSLWLALSPAQAATTVAPVVKGPEAVQDWYNAGNQFIAEGKRLVPNVRRAKNVIFFVGDGMGISTQTAARILEGQLNGKTGEENRLSFETLPYSALSKTYSWDQQTSDSAPTMTAMITGYKTRESMLSVNHTTARFECDGNVIATKSLPTMLELAAAYGKATGVVSTARLTHATPAATYAHTAVRDWESDKEIGSTCANYANPVKDIARQLIEVSPTVRNSLKVAMGGGRTYFLPKTLKDPEYSGTVGRRNDGRNLTAEWVSTRGGDARYVWNRAGFDAIDPATSGPVLGLFEPSHMQYEADRKADTAGEPSLTEMTEKSIKLLQKSPNGFFLHVEAGRIDHGHHAGNAKRALLDTIELSNAVRKAMELTSDADTLIIVSADHSHTFTVAGYPHRGNDILGLVKPVPNVDGTSVSPSLADDGKPYTTLGYMNGPGVTASQIASGVRPDLSSVDTTALGFLQQAAIPLSSSETHAGEDVGVWARGPKAYLVRGSMEQNWIFHVMKEAFGF